MSSTDAALVAVTLFGSGLLAGVLFGVAVGVVPAFAAVSAEGYVSLHRVVGAGFDQVMPKIVFATTLFDVIAGIRIGGTVAGLLFTAAALQVGVALVSQLGNVPINRRVRSLSIEDALPADWSDPRAAWRRLHLLRTAFAIAALAAHALVLVTLF
jgi:uncharacterized membrane protein